MPTIGAHYSSETNFVAISGQMEIGGVSWDVLSDQTSRFRWSRGVVDSVPVSAAWGRYRVDETKAALERSWLGWVARAGLSRSHDSMGQFSNATGHVPSMNGGCSVSNKDGTSVTPLGTIHPPTGSNPGFISSK
jgi:hypothetical protein